MSSKRLGLAAALQEASGKKPISHSILIDSSQLTERETKGQPPSRMGKKIVSGHFEPAVVRQLKQIALDRDTTIQGLLAEALNDLFMKYNQKPIA
jgi:hypothetical protein